MIKNVDMKEDEREKMSKEIAELNEKITEEQKEFINFLETDYKCSGICEPSFFYITMDLKTGRPENTCALSLIDSIADEFTLFGYCIFFTGVVMLLMFIVQFPLFCYDADKL